MIVIQVIAKENYNKFISPNSKYWTVGEYLTNEFARIDEVGVPVFVPVNIVDFFKVIRVENDNAVRCDVSILNLQLQFREIVVVGHLVADARERIAEREPLHLLHVLIDVELCCGKAFCQFAYLVFLRNIEFDIHVAGNHFFGFVCERFQRLCDASCKDYRDGGCQCKKN